MAIDSRAKEAIEYLDGLIADQQKKILNGECKADRPEQTSVNYQAAVELSKRMVRMRKQIAAIFTKKAEGDEDDGE